MDCKTCEFSVYYEGGFDSEFHKHYNGVIVNARGKGGYGHFAIRKPVTLWFKLPKFIKRLFPYKWIMWKNDREKMYALHFNDVSNSITIDADMKNHSFRCLTFDKNTYEDLKEHIPDFLGTVGFSFDTVVDEGCLTLEFKYRHYEIVNGKCTVPQGVTEVGEEMYWGFLALEELELPEGLTGIGNQAFYGCTRLAAVTFPAGVKNVGDKAFYCCPIRDISLRSSDPDDYVYLADALEGKLLDQVTLHVPAGSEEDYRHHSFFKNFKEVINNTKYGKE